MLLKGSCHQKLFFDMFYHFSSWLWKIFSFFSEVTLTPSNLCFSWISRTSRIQKIVPRPEHRIQFLVSHPEHQIQIIVPQFKPWIQIYGPRPETTQFGRFLIYLLLGDNNLDPMFWMGDKKLDPMFWMGDKKLDPMFWMGDKFLDPTSTRNSTKT